MLILLYGGLIAPFIGALLPHAVAFLPRSLGPYRPTQWAYCPTKRPCCPAYCPRSAALLPRAVALLPRLLPHFCPTKWPYCPMIPQCIQRHWALIAPRRPYCPTRGALIPQDLWGNKRGNRDNLAGQQGIPQDLRTLQVHLSLHWNFSECCAGLSP